MTITEQISTHGSRRAASAAASGFGGAIIRAILPLCLLMASTVLYGQFSTVPCTNGETGICRQATTCSQANVQAAVNASSAGTTGYVSPTNFGGDGVYVPAGTCSWSSSVSWTNKNINVIGANPTITHSSHAFSVTVSNSGSTGAAFRISGFSFSGSSSGHLLLLTGSTMTGATTIPTTGAAWAGFFRVDHLTYNYSSITNVFQFYGSVFGVFDHLNGTTTSNHFEQSNLLDAEYNNTHGGDNSQLEGEYAGRILSGAPGSSAPGGLGSKYLDYIEDSTFNCPGNYSGAISDSESGGQRMAFRHNTLNGTCFWYAHWTRGTEWDGDLYEIYNNTNTGSSDGQNPSRFGSGTGVVFNNSFPGTWTNPHFLVDETRGAGGETGNGPFFDCQGTRAIDGNAGDPLAPGWPCAGQIGTAFLNGNGTRHGQGSLPLLAWNNGTQTGCATGGSCTNSFTIQTDGCQGSTNHCTRPMDNYISATPHVVSGPLNGAVDYCQGNTTMPSTCGIYTNTYTPYTYPYPTTTGGVTTYTLSTATAGSGAGTITGCAGTYPPGGIFTCTPHAGTGSTLASISGCGGTWNGTVLQGAMPAANCTVTATFTGTSIPVATGDSRTVTEPTFPTVCSTVKATKFIVQTTAVNLDPYNSTYSPLGTLGGSGGTSWEPSSSSSSYVASEALDNSAVSAAISACPAGQAVELIPGDNGEHGFVLGRWSIKSGVGVILDAGIHVFASRNRSDYAGTNCGIVTTGSSSCSHWITAPSTSGSGIYGYGILDGRGWDSYIGDLTHSFYTNRTQAYCNNHGGPINGYPNCTPNSSGNNSYGPNALDLVGANNFTLYKVTVRDSGNFLLNWKSGNGFTAWGVKLLAPFEMSNTDGFDPVDSTNATFTYGFISNGDNQCAGKASGGPLSNITISHNQFGAGIGCAIGSATQHSVKNVSVRDNVHNGNLFNADSAGDQIGSSTANGGSVDTVTFQRECMVNEAQSIRFYTNYGGQSGSNTPVYSNIGVFDFTVLPSTAPYPTGNSGTFTFQGLNGFPMQVGLNNFHILGINQGVKSQNGVNKDQYVKAVLGPGAVPASILSQFAAGTSVATSGTAGSSSPYTCTASLWKPLVGEFNLKNSTSNNNQSFNTTPGVPFTLQAVLEPTTDVSTKEQPAPTASVTFLDNGVSIGSAAMTDGYAFLNVASASAGTHNYTVSYPGDSHYAQFGFGSISVVSTSGPTCGDPSQLSPNFSGTYAVPPTTLPLTVGFTSPTSGCAMHYTSDGSDPTCSSTAYPGGNFSINSAGTFTYKVIACQGGYTSSAVQGGAWTINTTSTVQVTLSGQQSYSGTVKIP